MLQTQGLLPMKYKPNTLVALRDRPGMFMVQKFDALKNVLIVMNSATGNVVETFEEKDRKSVV